MIAHDIPEPHNSALGSVATHHQVADVTLSKIYKACLAWLNQGIQPTGELSASAILVPEGNPSMRVAVVTDMKNGWYVQLVRVNGKAAPLMTCGHKFALEGYRSGNEQVSGQSVITMF